MRLDLLAKVGVEGDAIVVREVPADKARRADLGAYFRACGERVLVSFATEEDAMLIRSNIERAKADGARAEQARILRVRNAIFTGVVLDDDMKALLVQLDAAILSPGDGRS